jgi:hypothetical protein
MTRVHVRLLGPCFKTGPKSTQSSSVADRYRGPRARARTRGPGATGDAFAGLSKVNRTSQQRARTGDGTRSVNLRVPWRALATASTHRHYTHGPDERTARARGCGLIPCVYRRAAGRATGGLTRAVLPAARQSPHPGRRPTPSGSRRSTRGEVHDDERRTSTHGSVPAREPRGPAWHRPPTRSQRR